MPLVPSVLEAQLLLIFNEAKENPMTEAQLANKMATAIDSYIKTATVSTVVTGTAPPPAGIVTATGTGTLS